MSTTTIRLEDDLKARINAAAAQAGKTAHAFILEAIAQTVEQVETPRPTSPLAPRAGAPASPLHASRTSKRQRLPPHDPH